MKIIQLTLATKRSLYGVLFVAPWLFGFIFLFAIPLYESFVYSLSELKLAMGGFETTFKGLAYYKELFTVHPTFNRLLVDSTVEMLLNVPSIVIFSLFAATLLNQKFRGRGIARAIFFLPVLLSASVLSLEMSNGLGDVVSGITGDTNGKAGEMFSMGGKELMFLLMDAGLPLQLIGFIVDFVTQIYQVISKSGVQILIFLAALQSISPSLYEAAKIEGTTGYEAFWKITFPMISPMLLTNIVYTIIDSFTNNKLNKLIMDTAFQSLNFSQSAAMAWVYFAMTSLILVVAVGLISRKVFYHD